MDSLESPEWDYSLSEIRTLCEEVYTRFSDKRIWLLEGMLGAGKTTFVQHLMDFLQTDDSVLSPTFSLVNEYRSRREAKVLHLDLYRLQNLDQAMEIGLFEMEESGYFCLIEWASAVNYFPSEPFIRLEFTHLEETKRRLRIQVHEN